MAISLNVLLETLEIIDDLTIDGELLFEQHPISKNNLENNSFKEIVEDNLDL